MSGSKRTGTENSLYLSTQDGSQLDLLTLFRGRFEWPVQDFSQRKPLSHPPERVQGQLERHLVHMLSYGLKCFWTEITGADATIEITDRHLASLCH